MVGRRRSLLIGALALVLGACSDSTTANPAADATVAATDGTTAATTVPAPSASGRAVDDSLVPASVGGRPEGSRPATAPDEPADTGSSVALVTAVTDEIGDSTTSSSTTSSTTSTTTTVPATTTTVPGQPPVVEAAAYAVFDPARGTFLAQSQADAQLPVGSLMKLLAAQVAYAAGNPTRVIPAPEGLLLSDDESNIGIRPGQELARDLLIRAMLKASANDAARMLAIDIAGSEAAFAEQMNATAAALGLANTRAVNATGLDADGQYSSANDMTRLGVLLMENPSFQLAVRDPTAELNGQAFPNTNDLIGTYPGADGIKTGRTANAGWCVLASATRENRRMVVAVLGAPSEDARRAAATALLDWGFAQP